MRKRTEEGEKRRENEVGKCEENEARKRNDGERERRRRRREREILYPLILHPSRGSVILRVVPSIQGQSEGHGR